MGVSNETRRALNNPFCNSLRSRFAPLPLRSSCRLFLLSSPPHLLHSLPLDPLSRDGAASDGTAASEGLEFGVRNHTVVVHLNLKLHNIATGRGPDQTSTHSVLLLIEGPDISGVLVVLDNIVVIHPEGVLGRAGEERLGKEESVSAVEEGGEVLLGTVQKAFVSFYG
jgi:hypothetical protein